MRPIGWTTIVAPIDQPALALPNDKGVLLGPGGKDSDSCAQIVPILGVDRVTLPDGPDARRTLNPALSAPIGKWAWVPWQRESGSGGWDWELPPCRPFVFFYSNAF